MSAMGRKLLCADAEQQVALTSRGLDPTLLEAPWLTVCSRARAAREAIAASPAIEEAIVLSSEEVEGINLAAALKVDAPACRVYLAACEETGSVRSRLAAAHLDGVLSLDEVVRRLSAEAVPDTVVIAADGASGRGREEERSAEAEVPARARWRRCWPMERLGAACAALWSTPTSSSAI